MTDVLTDTAPKKGREEDLSQYLQMIRKYPMLTESEELELAKLCAAGDEDAVRRLVNANLRLVVSIAREYAYLSRAAFVTAYIPVKGKGSRGASSLVVITMRLPFLRSGRKVLFTRNAPCTFTLKILSNALSSISTRESSI